MSGSGGGSYVPPQRTNFDCETSQIKNTVSSINLEVLKKHDIGSILDVDLNGDDILILEDGDGEVLGSILHLNTEDLIECIKRGHEYEAKIIQKTSMTCVVLIKRK